MAAAELENVLKKLLLPDSNAIQQATLELKRAFLKPEVAIPALAELLQTCQDITIRQYCAILIRRRAVKNWKNVPVEIRSSLKILLLDCVTKETCASVHSAIAQAIGSVARHELSTNNWPEVMQFISSCVLSGVVAEREVGYSLLKSVSESAAEQLQPLYKDLFPAFEKGLCDGESKHNAFNTIKSMTGLLPYFGTDEEKLLKPLLGKVLDVIKFYIKEDEDKANEALDFFDELVQIEVGIIVPYVKSLVEFCMQIVGCNDLSNGLRIKALYLVCWACRRKTKTLTKEHLMKPLINLLLQVISIPEPDDDPDIEEDEEGEDTNSISSVAAQALDLLSLHSPPEKLIPMILESLSPLFVSDDLFQRKAAYLALGALAEGCADYIRNKHLQDAVETCMKGLNDQTFIVRNAALFALGQYAEHVQPEFGKFHATVLPFLMTFLQTVVNDPNAKTNHKGTLTKLFYAIEKFTEGLEKEIIQLYTDGLMEAFLSLLKMSKSPHDTELAISAIGALATSAQGNLSSYFPIIMENLKVVLAQPITDVSLELHSQTVDTLGALARYINREVFLPVAAQCMEFGLKLIEDCEDPDLRRCTYGLFSSISVVLKFDMSTYLAKIIPPMINSLKSTEGVMANYEENGDPSFLLDDIDEEDILNEDDDDDDEDEQYTSLTVENAYMDEKEDAINSLAEISENVGNGILPYMEEIFKEAFLLIDFPHCNVRKASVTACCRLCIVIYKVIKENNVSDLTAVHDCIKRTFPTTINVINKDDDRSVVIACVEVLEEVLKEIAGNLFIEANYADELAATIISLMKGKTNCQQFLEEDTVSTASVDDDESQAELDHMLVERTGDLLPVFASAIGGENFKNYFKLFLPEIMRKTKKSSQVSERSFAAGTTAEIIQAMNQSICEFVPTIFPWLMGLLQDANEEVRSNTAFAIGVLAEQGKESVKSFYGNILQALFTLLSSEQPPLVQDNICGAVARMITASPESLPLDQVLPMLVGLLPIKEDESENKTVTNCFIQLYKNNNTLILPYMEKLLPWFISSINDEKSGLDADIREQTKLFVTDIQSKYPTEFNQIVGALNINGFA